MEQLFTIPIPLWALIAYIVFMCAVQSLPRPKETSSPFYIWAYGFLNLLSANWKLFFDPTNKGKLAAGNRLAPPPKP